MSNPHQKVDGGIFYFFTLTKMKVTGKIILQQITAGEMLSYPVGTTVFLPTGPVRLHDVKPHRVEFQMSDGTMTHKLTLNGFYKPVLYVTSLHKEDEKFLRIKTRDFRLCGRFLSKDNWGKYFVGMPLLGSSWFRKAEKVKLVKKEYPDYSEAEFFVPIIAAVREKVETELDF